MVNPREDLKTVLLPMIQYTVQSSETKISYSFSDHLNTFYTSLRLLLKNKFELVGIQGINRYKCPTNKPLSAHRL